MLTKKQAEKLMKIECKGRGEHLLAAQKIAFDLGGEKGVKKLKKEMEKLGCTINFEQIDPLGWYSIGLRIITLVVLKEIFNLKDGDFVKIGSRGPKFSFVSKFFFRHFLSRRTAFEHIPEYWEKHYTCGKLKPGKMHEGKDSYLTLRLYDFKFHPIYCKYFKGYFLQISKLLGGTDATIEETKCMFKRDPYHEFLIKWHD